MRRKHFLFLRRHKAKPFQVVLAHYVQAQEVGGAGLGPCAGHNRNHLATAHVALLQQLVLRHFHQGLGRVHLRAADRRRSPKQVQPVDGDFDRAQREDRRAGVILRKLPRRCARLREQRDAAQVQVVGRMRRRFANRLRNRQVALLVAHVDVLVLALHVPLRLADDARHH